MSVILALQLREELPTDVFTDAEVIGLVNGTADRRYGLVKRAIAAGDLIQVRRGAVFRHKCCPVFELFIPLVARSKCTRQA